MNPISKVCRGIYFCIGGETEIVRILTLLPKEACLELLSSFNFSFPASGSTCDGIRRRGYARKRAYLSRSRGLKRHTALDKTSGLASPRANYPHLFLDRVRKRAARTSSSRHRRAAAAAWSRRSARARAGLSRCSADDDFSGLTHDRFHR